MAIDLRQAQDARAIEFDHGDHAAQRLADEPGWGTEEDCERGFEVGDGEGGVRKRETRERDRACAEGWGTEKKFFSGLER